MNKSLPTGIFDQVRLGKKCQNANFLVEELIAIILLKRDKRMNVAVEALVAVFGEEEDEFIHL
jgi:hypothetical protein